MNWPTRKRDVPANTPEVRRDPHGPPVVTLGIRDGRVLVEIEDWRARLSLAMEPEAARAFCRMIVGLIEVVERQAVNEGVGP